MARDLIIPDSASITETSSSWRTPPARHQGRRFAHHLACVLALVLGSGFLSWPGSSTRAHAAPAASSIQVVEPGSPLPRGHVVRRTLAADSTQEYLLYVPESGGRGASLFVTTHGVSRNVEEHATLFAPYAEKYRVVLVAPSFTTEGNAGYQRLEGADKVLEAVVTEVGLLTGAATGKLYLFGFSGGAQFTHRYTMAHPDRVAAAVVGAAGWYTFPDSATPYPYGLGPGEGRDGLTLEPARFLQVPITVMVGGADTGTKNLRQNPEVDRQQGKTRLERAQRWTAAMRRAAEARGLEPRVTCELVAGIGHSFRQFMEEGQLGDRTFNALFGPSRSTKPRPDEIDRNAARTGSR